MLREETEAGYTLQGISVKQTTITSPEGSCNAKKLHCSRHSLPIWKLKEPKQPAHPQRKALYSCYYILIKRTIKR